MQTFLPYPDFEASVATLDYRRLGKQRVECFQLLKVLGNSTDVDLTLSEGVVQPELHKPAGRKNGWANHPATRMWRGYEGALAEYHDACINEWVKRGYNNTMRLRAKPGPWPKPPFFGDAEFHASHRSNLLRKLPEHYSQFGWTEGPDLPYIWPV